MKLGMWYLRIQRRESGMPWKDPQLWNSLISAYVLAPFLAFITSAFRIFYDEHEPRMIRTMLESAICGLLAVAATAAIQAMGLTDKWAVFVGGVIGFMGADYIRFVARDIIRQRTQGTPYHYHSYWRSRRKYSKDDQEGG